MDSHLRDIERRIAAGDPSAWPRLFRNWRRSGSCDVENFSGSTRIVESLREMVEEALSDSNISHTAFDDADLEIWLENYNSNTFLAHFFRRCLMPSEEPRGTPVMEIQNVEMGHMPAMGDTLRNHLLAEEHVVSAFRQNENSGDRWFHVTEVTESWGNMQPDIQDGQWVTVTDSNGEETVFPFDDLSFDSPLVYDIVTKGDFTDRDAIYEAALEYYPHAQTQQSEEEFAEAAARDFETALEGHEIVDLHYYDGWAARLSMPGYMDSTEWSIHTTYDGAMQYLTETYGPDELVADLHLDFTLEIRCDYVLDLQHPQHRRNPMTFSNRWRWGYNSLFRRNPDEQSRRQERELDDSDVTQYLRSQLRRGVIDQLYIDRLAALGDPAAWPLAIPYIRRCSTQQRLHYVLMALDREQTIRFTKDCEQYVRNKYGEVLIEWIRNNRWNYVDVSSYMHDNLATTHVRDICAELLELFWNLDDPGHGYAQVPPHYGVNSEADRIWMRDHCVRNYL